MNSPYNVGWREGLWSKHPTLVHMLGLSPLLAVSTSVVSGLTLGLVTLVVLMVASTVISLVRHQTKSQLRLPMLILLIATPAIAADLLLQAWSWPLSQSMGLYVSLIAANSLLFVHADQTALTQPPLYALRSGVQAGLGYLVLLLGFGAVRELLGTGAVFADFEQLLPSADEWTWRIFSAENYFHLAHLPAGACFLLAGVIALRNILSTPESPASSEMGSKRVRVTGKPQGDDDSSSS